MLKQVVAIPGRPAPRGFSPAIKAGNTLYISGQVGVDENRNLAKGDVVAQAEQAYKNIQAVLEAAGCSFDNLVKLNTYLTRVDDVPIYFDKVREVRMRFFTGDDVPAATLVVVSALANPDLLIEVEGIAVLD